MARCRHGRAPRWRAAEFCLLWTTSLLAGDYSALVTSTSTPPVSLLLRLVGLLLILLGLVAVTVTLYLLPWGVGGGHVLVGYQVIGYVNAHTGEFTGTPAPALYYVSMGTFVILGAGALLSLTTGTRSRTGRLVAAAFALLAVPLLALA